MGTDIYLKYKKQTKEEQDAQYTGFANAGEAGYLRASIHMTRENDALRLLFPKKYWESSTDEPYDFVGNYEMLVKVLRHYIGDNDMMMSEDTEKDVQRANIVQDALTKLFPDAELHISTSAQGEQEKKQWARHVADFWKLGIKMQEEGKEPYPLISW